MGEGATPSRGVPSTLKGCLVLHLRYDGHHFGGMLSVWEKRKTYFVMIERQKRGKVYLPDSFCGHKIVINNTFN